MGMHAQDAYLMALDEEFLRDDYATGNMSMEEAFERGFLDASGAEQEGIQEAYARMEIPTPEYLDNQLLHAEKDLALSMLMAKRDKLVAKRTGTTEFYSKGEVPQYAILNQEAIDNLAKDTPTCNICRESMQPRVGRYGKFYYCANACKGQKCVSDKYWQSVKK